MMTSLMILAQKRPRQQQLQHLSPMVKMVHIVIVVIVKCLDPGVNPSPLSAETTLKCGKDYGYFCPKRSEKTNKNLHPLHLRNRLINSIHVVHIKDMVMVIRISMGINIIIKQIIELHQHRHQLHPMLGLVNLNQDPKAKNLRHQLYLSILTLKKLRTKKPLMNFWTSLRVIKNLQMKRNGPKRNVKSCKKFRKLRKKRRRREKFVKLKKLHEKDWKKKLDKQKNYKDNWRKNG